MKKIIILCLFFNLVYSQDKLFEPGYSGFGFSYSKTLRDISVNSISINRNTSSNYFIEAMLNYIDENESESGINSAGLRFSKMYFKNKDRVPISGYTNLGVEFMKISDIYISLNLGFGIFESFRFGHFSMIPEFKLNYYLMLSPNDNHSRWGPEQYLNFDNMFVFGFALNNVINISKSNLIIITPGIVASEDDYSYKIKVGINFGS